MNTQKKEQKKNTHLNGSSGIFNYYIAWNFSTVYMLSWLLSSRSVFIIFRYLLCDGFFLCCFYFFFLFCFIVVVVHFFLMEMFHNIYKKKISSLVHNDFVGCQSFSLISLAFFFSIFILCAYFIHFCLLCRFCWFDFLHLITFTVEYVVRLTAQYIRWFATSVNKRFTVLCQVYRTNTNSTT